MGRGGKHVAMCLQVDNLFRDREVSDGVLLCGTDRPVCGSLWTAHVMRSDVEEFSFVVSPVAEVVAFLAPMNVEVTSYVTQH